MNDRCTIRSCRTAVRASQKPFEERRECDFRVCVLTDAVRLKSLSKNAVSAISACVCSPMLSAKTAKIRGLR